MEKEQRNRLQKATQDTRKLLEEEFRSQLLQTYDIDVDRVRWAEEPGAHLQAEQRLIREKLVAWIEHKEAQISDRKEALLLALREMAFTALNRFVALKLMEARELVRPCVSGGLESAGFLEFTAVAQGLLTDQESSYRLYLETIFEDVSCELRALFDPRDPASLLWPKRAALLELLDILNRPELTELWIEDETLGWVYQYFNGDAERRKMREESAAPRNSRELAVRNQFFTPRYVVEFLTDNTLGRIWYEMRQGNTGLKDQCRYLVRRPNEVWLQPGEEPPAQGDTDETLSQEELLREPVYIPHRPLKDPREIRMLDPACGSMHFGLYAFDLYLEIYKEAWEIAQDSDEQCTQEEAFSPFVAYAAGFADKSAFLREVPKLILQHNIHGIDIDPRATQIARLTLWLRAQRAWQEHQLRVADRPTITRSNVVCAEPMPGERELLADFVDQQFPDVERGLVQQLLETIIEKMQLAGDAGSLLQIEEEIRDVIEQSKREWQKLAFRQQDLFNKAELEALGQLGSSLNIDLLNLTKDFWINIEERIYAALRRYSERAESGYVQRRLFAEDTARGFSFIDACRKRYDAILMNPPFGLGTTATRGFFEEKFPFAKSDLSIASVDRGLNLLAQGGRVGAITTRTVFFNSTFASWRANALENNTFAALSDLGYGVLDAMVETVMYVLENRKPAETSPACFTSLLATQDKSQHLAEMLHGKRPGILYREQKSFRFIPNTPLAYWLPSSLLSFFGSKDSFLGAGGAVAVGIQTGDNPRFFRLRWEIPALEDSTSVSSIRWVPIGKGGEYSPWWDDVHLTVMWEDNGAQIKEHPSSCVRNSNWFYQPGCTYPYRTTSGFGLRCLPAGCVFSDGGWGVFPPQGYSREDSLAVFNSRIGRYFMEVLLGQGDSSVAGSAARNYTNDAVGSIPWISQSLPSAIHDLVKSVVSAWRQNSVTDETTCFFTSPVDSSCLSSSLIESARLTWLQRCSLFEQIGSLSYRIENAVLESYGISEADKRVIDAEEGCHPFDYPSHERDNEAIRGLYLREVDHVAAEVQRKHGSKRFVVKKSFAIDRKIDLISHYFKVSAEVVIAAIRTIQVSRLESTAELPFLLLSYALGCIFGRWDIRFLTDQKIARELPDPFAPLPSCPPGQLQNSHGLPVRPEDVPATYPVQIPWAGIIVDDLGNSLDIERQVRRILEVIWNDKGPHAAQAIENEVCGILQIRSLRDYFRNPACFFAEHLRRYSKSRRQAPIYWQLSAGSGSYSAWLYYHRLTQDTLYRVLRDFVEPRIQQAEREQFELESHDALSGDAAARLQEGHTLLQELRILKGELDLVVPLWNPNLNDGVIINHAILWRITPYTPWQKKCKECWDKLVKGDYDWAHLAFHLWPERVIPKCTTDRSLAIAHGLEERLWQETNNGNWLPRQLSEADLQALIAEHSNPAVKSALERFLAAPPPVAPTRTRASRSTRASGSSTPRRARGSAAVVDAEATRQVLLALSAAPSDGLAKAAIADLIGVEANALTAVIKQLKESGQIDQLGERRGARYVLSEQGRAAVASRAGEDD